MAQSKGSIHLSMCTIKKERPGKQLATEGSACVVEWSLETPERLDSSSDRKSQVFLVTTNQVINKYDLKRSSCTANFLPVNWGSIQTFNLNRVPIDEIIELQIPDQNEISLILIPTEPLHKQKFSSLFLSNRFQSTRCQQCHKDSGKSEFQEADGTPQELCCYVVRENDKVDKFDLTSYALGVDESCSYYLRVHGNDTKLRKLGDFRYNEFPKGAVVLNELGNIVQFLAFDKDKKILPVFFSKDLQGDEKPMEDLPDDSGPSKPTSDSEANGHVNKIDKENNLQRESLLLTFPENVMNKDIRGSDEGNFDIITGNRREPAEVSYHSGTFVASREQISCTGEKNRAGTEQNDDPETRRHGIQRSESEQLLTPRSRKKLLKSYYSQCDLIPLKTGATVEQVILPNIYAREALARCLDTTYVKNNENWQHLASRRQVSEDLIMRLKLLSPKSHSEAMFRLLGTRDPDLLTGTLSHHLRDLEMENVLQCIKDFSDDKNIAEALEAGEVPGRFFILLDQRSVEEWKKLGDKLGLDISTLDGILTDCAVQHQNPAEDVIELVCSYDPTMTIGQFKKHLENIQRKDVKKKLSDISEKLPIKSLRDNLDLMRVVTRMLNVADNRQIKNFKDLAEECGISPEKYRNLQPPCTESPTEEVLQDIVGRKPLYSVCELFIDLREMNRKDAVEAISVYFVEDDIKALKRQLQITPE